MAKTEKAHGNA